MKGEFAWPKEDRKKTENREADLPTRVVRGHPAKWGHMEQEESWEEPWTMQGGLPDQDQFHSHSKPCEVSESF